MIDFEFDPEETVEWAGVGDLTLRTAVRRIMALSPENRRLIALYRNAGKEPAFFGLGAEAKLKKTQKAQRATEGSQAMSEYVAAGHAVRAKTARLRELRLAKEAADKKDKTKQSTKSK